MNHLKKIIDQFKTKKIVVVGDVMLDRYIHGVVERISPEAPIPIVQRRETFLAPGGAGNTAANNTALGATCTLFGAIGEDSTAQELVATLKTFGIDPTGLIKDKRPTTEKIRVIGNHQQIARIDHESLAPLAETQTKKLCQALAKAIRMADAVIVCDYAKGVVSEQLMDCLRNAVAKKAIPLLADVRPEHRDWYSNLDFITPNKKETSGMVYAPVRNRHEAETEGLKLAQKLKTNILLTMSEEGMLVINYKTGTIEHLPTKAQEVIDVSGAGDTVIATMTLALASGATPKEAAILANHAASLVVAKLGTATVSAQELAGSF
jgi:D-glycero-beta-D-manno-heptose-7-phosphate kinase